MPPPAPPLIEHEVNLWCARTHWRLFRLQFNDALAAFVRFLQLENACADLGWCSNQTMVA